MTLDEIADAMERLEVRVRAFRGELKLAALAEHRVTDAEREGGLAAVSARAAAFVSELEDLMDAAKDAERRRPVIEPEEPVIDPPEEPVEPEEPEEPSDPEPDPEPGDPGETKG